MSESWVRLWSGATTDPKWQTIARKSGQPRHLVIAVFIHLMMIANDAPERGRVSGASTEDMASAMDCDEEQIDAILSAMDGRVIKDGLLSGWENRQPARVDAIREGSKAVADRVREHRQRKKEEELNADVTRGNACNADVTRGNAPESESESEAEVNQPPSSDPTQIAEPAADIPEPAAPDSAEVEDFPVLVVVEASPATKSRSRAEMADEQAACRTTWSAYSDAYRDRYGVSPVRNAKVNAAIKSFTRRIGADESPGVARYYLSHSDAFYARKCHDVGPMLADAEKLRTEWATQRQVTGVTARQQERTGTMRATVERILAAREATG